MDTGNVHGVMIRAAFSDFSEGVRLRITGEAPPAADLIWGPITAFVAGARAAANLRKNQRKPLNIVRGLEKAKTQFGKRRKRTSQTSWYHREDVEKNKGLALPCQTCGRHYDDLAGHHA